MIVSLMRPAQGAVHALAGVLMADGIFGTFVERHEDVAAEGELGVNRGFGCELMGAAIQVGLKRHAFVRDLAQAGEREDLEAAGIGKNGVGPGHEAMQAAELADELMTGAEVEVIGVGEEDAARRGPWRGRVG